jgi:4-hydroxy-4-methyl-2-oxoglutarate aldolase
VPEIVEQFHKIPTSFIIDALGGRGAMDWRIKAVGRLRPFVGTALPCYCGPADNLALCAAVAQCLPGDVLVAATDSYTGTSVVGDLLLGIAKNRGASAFITDGLIRDAHDIEGLDFPCYAMGVTPNSPARNGPGSIGLPVSCGGLQIAAGDIVAGDRDGVVVIPQSEVNAVVERLAAVREAEAQMLAKVKAGLTEVGFVADLLASSRVRYVES